MPWAGPGCGDHSRRTAQYFYIGRDCQLPITGPCPPGYKKNTGTLAGTFTPDGGGDPEVYALRWNGTATGGVSPGYVLEGLADGGVTFADPLFEQDDHTYRTYCLDKGHVFGVLYSYYWYGGAYPDQLDGVSGRFQTYDPAHNPTTLFTYPCHGDPAVGELRCYPNDMRMILDAYGNPYRPGCSTTIDTTFQVLLTNPDHSGRYGTLRITGDLCVPDPCAPPPDLRRYWYKLKKTYPYIEKVAGGLTTDFNDRTPDFWLSGPYFKTYVRTVGPPNCEGYWQDVPDPEPYEPNWGVRYQNYDADGHPVGRPYDDCHTSGTAGIVCKNWDKAVTCEGTALNTKPGPETVETGLDLDPDHDNAPGSVTRSRTYIDGPWPNDSFFCCKSFKACAGRMVKGPFSVRYEFGEDAQVVTSDFGKKPGGGPFEAEAYLRCRLGNGFDKFDVVRYPGSDDPDAPKNGYSAGKKQSFRQILGAPKETVKGDDESPESDGTDYPALLGEVNDNRLKSWGVPTAEYGGEPGSGLGMALYTRWWVTGPVGEFEDDPVGHPGVLTRRLTVVETLGDGFVRRCLAGPFDSTGTDDSGRNAGKALAIAAAVPAGPFWCGEYTDKDADGHQVGPKYVTCVDEADLPDPGDPPLDSYGNPIPRYHYGLTFDGLDPRDGSPEAVVGRSLRLVSVSSWVGAAGVGAEPLDQCKAQCPPCSQRAGQANDDGMMMMAARPSVVRLMAATARPAPVAAVAPRPPCRHELPVVSWAPCGDPARHVRACGWDGHEFDLCVRGGSGNPQVKSCQSCPGYDPAVLAHGSPSSD